MRNLLTLVAISIMALVSLSGCHKKASKGKSAPAKEIDLVVKKDSQLQLSQEELLKRRGALIRQRNKLKEQRAALEAKKRVLAATDPKAAKALEAKEQELTQQEKTLLTQEQEVTKHLNDLLKKRTELLSRATAALTASASAGAPPVAKREHAVALREKDLARREKQLAMREEELAKREASVAKRERALAKGCAAFAPSIVMPKISMPALPAGRRYTKADVNAVLGRAARYLAAKGLSASDLPREITKYRDAARAALRKKKYAEAKQQADIYLAALRSIKLDRLFLARKLRHLNSLAQKKKLSGPQQRKVNRLLEEAMRAYSDGKFKRANSKLNQIAKLLR